MPERYRAAVVLCLLEGLNPEQAARQLGWPVGTVQSRLARGGSGCAARLTRRGLAPPPRWRRRCRSEAARAAVPAALVASTVRAATRFAAGKVATGRVPAPGGDSC